MENSREHLNYRVDPLHSSELVNVLVDETDCYIITNTDEVDPRTDRATQRVEL